MKRINFEYDQKDFVLDLLQLFFQYNQRQTLFIYPNINLINAIAPIPLSSIPNIS